MMPVASLSSPSLAVAPQPLRALRRGRTLGASPRLRYAPYEAVRPFFPPFQSNYYAWEPLCSRTDPSDAFAFRQLDKHLHQANEVVSSRSIHAYGGNVASDASPEFPPAPPVPLGSYGRAHFAQQNFGSRCTHHRHVRMARARAGEQTAARREAGLQVVSKPASPLMDIPVPAVECDQSPAQDAGTTAHSAVLSAAAVLALVGLSTQPALADAVDAMEPIMDAVSEQGSLQEGFLSAFLLIFFSEIGDKTFFIAVLLALQKPKSAVFAGTFGALAIMTCISVALGEVLHLADEALHDSLPPALANQPLDDYAAVLLLVIFGVQTILGAKESGDAADEEREEAEEDVEKLTKSAPGGADLLPLILSTFALVFAAEWGDKSFLATIALAAAASPVGVVTGAIAGHGVATGVAVSGGSLLSEYLSQELVSYAGGSLFLVFAGATVLDIISKTT